LDDDDFWLPEYLEQIFKVIAANSAARVVVGSLYRSAKKGKIKRYKTFPDSPKAQREVYYRNPGFGGQNLTIDRRVFLEVGGFDESLPASVDRDLGARLLQGGFRIFVAAIAVLCHHERPRVRGNQVRGNRLFLAKHWRHMRWGERYKATRTLIQRLWRYQIIGRRPS
jgi:GT2 family glycosyltransferase